MLNETEPLTAIGFMGGTQRCLDTLKTRQPVFLQGTDLATPTIKEWTMGEIRTLAHWEDSAHVTRLRRGKRFPLQEGEVLWIAGQGFLDQCSILGDFPKVETIRDWTNRRFSGGDMYHRFGTLRDFTELSEAIFERATEVLHQAWMDDDAHTADAAYTLISNLRLSGSRQVMVTLGAHMLRTNRDEDYTALAETAAASPLFASRAEFDAAAASDARLQFA